MAFCTNCGKSLGDEARFCTNCGTPIQVVVPASVTVPSATAAAAPAVAPVSEPMVPATETREVAIPEVPAVVPEAPSSAPFSEFSTAPQSSTSPVFVIICVVLLLLIAGGIGGTVYLQRQGKAKAAAAQQTLPDTSQPSAEPSSNSSIPTVDSASRASSPTPVTSEETAAPAVLPVAPAPIPSRVPVADSVRAMNLGDYPGATPVGIATLTGETVVAGFLTRDTPHQVVQFYKIRFPVSTTTESDGKAELSATLPGGERIRIQAVPQGTNTQVMVLQEN